MAETVMRWKEKSDEYRNLTNEPKSERWLEKKILSHLRTISRYSKMINLRAKKLGDKHQKQKYEFAFGLAHKTKAPIR